MRTSLLALCLSMMAALPAAAIDQAGTHGPAPMQATSPQAGSRPGAGHDSGPAQQAPGDAGAQTQSRGTDGSTAGMTAPGATGASPQGMMTDTTAGSRQPNLPVGGAPPPSAGINPRP